MITRSDAIAAARKQYPLAGIDDLTEAYLVLATDPSTLKGDILISNKPIWLVHAAGMAYPVSVPAGANLKSDQTVSNGYIYIDAYTGAWLMSRSQD